METKSRVHVVRTVTGCPGRVVRGHQLRPGHGRLRALPEDKVPPPVALPGDKACCGGKKGHRWEKDADSARAFLVGYQGSAQRHNDRLAGLMKKTMEELDAIAREDVEEVRKSAEGLAAWAPKKESDPATAADRRSKPIAPPAADPEFFRDPTRAQLAERAPTDTPSGSA